MGERWFAKQTGEGAKLAFGERSRLSNVKFVVASGDEFRRSSKLTDWKHGPRNKIAVFFIPHIPASRIMPASASAGTRVMNRMSVEVDDVRAGGANGGVTG
jgi:hypothetical protein